jgi:hypothetical protein
MKKLITIIAVSLLTINAQAQYGGVIRAVNNSNVIGEIQRVGASMKVHDTALVNIQTAMKLKTDSIYTRLGSGVGVSSIPSATQTTLEDILATTGSIDATVSSYILPLKLKTDSIYKRMYQDSVNLAKLGTGVTITGSVNSTISGVTKKALLTQVVSADTGLVVNAVMHGLTTGGGGGYVDVKVNPSGALTVDATQSGTWNINNTASASDSSKYRSTIQVSNFPAIQEVNGTVSIDAGSILPLPLNAATESTLNQIATDLHYGKGASSTGVKGPMVLGAVSYMATAPLDSTLHPLSLNGKGAQRVVIMNGSTEVTTFADSTTASRRLVGITSLPTYSVSGTITTQNLTPTRTETAGSAVSALCDGYSTVSIKVRGAYNGALSVQFSNDDSTWTTGPASLIRVTPTFSTGATTIPTSDTGLWITPTYSFKRIRVTGLSTISGTATVFIVSNNGTNSVFINPLQTVNVLTSAGAVSASGDAQQYTVEDAASNNGFQGNKLLAVRGDTLTSATTSANGDWSQVTVTKSGVLLTKDEMRHRVTYRASSGSFTPAALATDIFTISGVASKTIMINKIIFSATQTAGSTFNVALIKRSTANTAGTATTMTAVPLDASDAAAGSTVQYYTANPTLGTTIGSVETVPIFCSTTATQPEKYEFDFGLKGKSIILNSASQALSINLGGVTMTGGACFVTIEWTETW